MRAGGRVQRALLAALLLLALVPLSSAGAQTPEPVLVSNLGQTDGARVSAIG